MCLCTMEEYLICRLSLKYLSSSESTAKKLNSSSEVENPMVNSRLKRQVQSTVSSSFLLSLLVREWIITLSQDMNCKGQQCMWNNRLQIEWFLSNKVMIKNKCIHSFVKVKVAQSCPNLCDPMDYTVHGMLQARKLEWVAFPFSRDSCQQRDQTQTSHTAGRYSTSEPQGKSPPFQFCNYVQIIRV